MGDSTFVEKLKNRPSDRLAARLSGNPTRVVKLRETAAFPAFRPARAIPSERTMCKLKVWHTVDAVLAGYYEDEATGTIDSLLFGLYGDDGLLHFVGHSRVYFDAAEIAKLLDPLKGGTGLTGRAPGGKSRWTGKTQKMVRLDPVPIQPCQSLRQSPVAITTPCDAGTGSGTFLALGGVPNCSYTTAFIAISLHLRGSPSSPDSSPNAKVHLSPAMGLRLLTAVTSSSRWRWWRVTLRTQLLSYVTPPRRGIPPGNITFPTWKRRCIPPRNAGNQAETVDV